MASGQRTSRNTSGYRATLETPPSRASALGQVPAPVDVPAPELNTRGEKRRHQD
jgi:hypothetical protein